MWARRVGLWAIVAGLAPACGAGAMSGDDEGGGDGGPRVDGGPVDLCHVPADVDDLDAPICEKPAPPASFNPTVKWTWTAPDNPANPQLEGSSITPLVAVMRDTDGSGEVNLCDVPSVIVMSRAGELFMLAGDTGVEQVKFDGLVDRSATPALADLDGDKVPEVIAADVAGHIVVYGADGHVKWTGPDLMRYRQPGVTEQHSFCQAFAVYDLDADGSPEILAAFEVFDRMGRSKFFHDVSDVQFFPSGVATYYCPASTAADLDGDGLQEAILGTAVYHADGTLYWSLPGPPAQPQVANLDDDDDPEIFFARGDGMLIVSHDGQIIAGPTQSFDPGPSGNCWSKPGAIGDFDGTGHASLMSSSCEHFGIWHVTPEGLDLQWSAGIDDSSGLASSTGFDLMGRGVANAIYGDQGALWVYDGRTGEVELTSPRSSDTLIEFPVVADVDNDGSADIVVVSDRNGIHPYLYTVQVLEDPEHRWAPTRRIWNQHAYHVTNVREDGTIPRVQPRSWRLLNTFRTNAQIENGESCAPPPPYID